MVIQTDRPLLQQAIAAVERDDLPRADALFLEHLAQDRADPVALADYGNFCLRTGRHEAASYLLQKAIALSAPDADLLTQLGFASLEGGDADGALHSFEDALKQDPTHPLANYGLAQCHQQAGSWLAAIAGFTVALAAQPQNLPILLNLADAYHKAGDAQAAATRYEQASRLAPNDPMMLLEYGKFLRDSGMFARALEKFAVLRQAHPDEPIVLLETARCFRAMGELLRADDMLEQLNRKAPNTPEYHEELGNCLALRDDAQNRDLHWGLAADQWIRAKQFELAEPLLETMLGTNPAYAVAWNLKGMCHEMQQQLEPAEAAYEHAIKTDPAWLDSYANLANLREQTNRIPQAKAVADAGLAMAASNTDKPHSSSVPLLLASVKVARRQKDHVLAMRRLDQIAQLEQRDLERQMTAFEHGKVLDLQNDVTGAIKAFRQGNALARIPWITEHPGDNTYLRGVEYMLDLAKNDWLKGWNRIDVPDQAVEPVFLAGFPRSGTTLLTQILYCHAAIEIAEEKPLVQAMRDSVRSMPAGYPHAIPRLDKYDVAYLRDVYHAAAEKHGVDGTARVLLDKLPLHVTMAGLIHRVFPMARFIFAIRHPCDVVLSCFMQDFRSNDAMANFFTLKDTVALYVSTMELWDLYQRDLGLSVHRIRYEDLVDDLETHTRSLCDFLGLPWQDDLRQFSTRALDRGKINTPSYEQVSKPIYREARYRWERYREHLAPFLPALQPYIERFGYSDMARAS